MHGAHHGANDNKKSLKKSLHYILIDLFYLFRYVFWYHNQRMINFDSERGIAVTTTPGRRTHSQLSISKAEVSDSVILNTKKFYAK